MAERTFNLIQNPQTELDYWINLEQLIRNINYERHGKSPSKSGTLKITQLFERRNAYIEELFLLFGVIHRNYNYLARADRDSTIEAPPGMIWYFDWYKKMELIFYQKEYEKLICSSCIFCTGFKDFFQTRARPCGHSKKYLEAYNEVPTKECAVLYKKKTTLTQLCYSIKYVGEERKEPAALYLFLKKMVELNNGYYGGIEKFLLDNLKKITNG